MAEFWMMDDVSSIDIRMRQDDEELKDGEWFDYSGLSDYATCPTYGIIKNKLRKTMAGGGRRMALEAGSAAHEVFAAVRCMQLLRQGLPEHFAFHGNRLFGEERFNSMCEYVGNEDPEQELYQFALEALYTSGFTDDAGDKRRTMGNIEEACIVYMQNYAFDKFPVWVQDVDDRESLVGIEMPVDMVVEFTTPDGVIHCNVIGKVDGIHTDLDGNLVLNENKTAGRLDIPWQMSFSMSHQLSVYTLAMSTMLGEVCSYIDVYGLALPMPRSGSLSGFLRIPEVRHEKHFGDFLRWLLHNRQVRDMYGSDVRHAPRNTNSCNRYFSICEFMPFCGSAEYDQQDVLNDMSDNEWNPLND